MLLIATYRNVSLGASHPLTPSLGELARNPSFEQISLPPFSADEVAVYVKATTGDAIPPETAHYLYGRTEGNPLYVSEITKLLASRGLQPRELSDSVPETVQLAIGQRMSHLAESCRHIVATGAAIGQEFSLTQLTAALCEVAEEPVQQALDEACKMGIIEEIAESPNRYRFAHKMIQEVAKRESSDRLNDPAADIPIHVHWLWIDQVEGCWDVSSEFLISSFLHLRLGKCIFMHGNGLLRISSNERYV